MISDSLFNQSTQKRETREGRLPSRVSLARPVLSCAHSKRLPLRLWLNTKECISSLLDSYVKVYLLVAGKRAKKKKTSVRKGTLNPVFNEAVSFDIAMDALNSVDLLLSVMHENEIIGCVPIGAHSTGKELDHWREVRTANKPVAHWHSLQDPKKFYQGGSLRSKRFRSSSSMKLGRERKRGMNGEGRGQKESFFFSSPPPPSFIIFYFRSNFCAITRSEKLATQATGEESERDLIRMD